MPEHVDAIYLSPHLDDAVLSCGAQIHDRAARGETVWIVTLNAGDPPPGAPLSPLAHHLHRLWGLPAEAPAARRQEDRTASALLGARPVHLDLLECVYRRDPATAAPLYKGFGAIFSRPAAADQAWLGAAAEQLAALPVAPFVAAPLGIGHHVDHLLTRQAAGRVFGAALHLYEDFPYLRRFLAGFRARRGQRLAAEVVPVSEAGVAARCAAIAAYATQVPLLFGDREQAARAVRAEVRRRGGERLWRRA